ncbi:MAG: hypothetical protein IKH12_03190 [Clostridia bacterium]|nr:hypothetical protein [Clostridia bacterium]
MSKRILALSAACLLLCCCGLFAQAENVPSQGDGAYYGQSEEDEWFDNGYEGIEKNDPDLVIEETEPPPQWYQRLSVVPVVIGVAAGVIVVAVLYRRSRPEPPEPGPYVLRPTVRVEEQRDQLTEETQTTRKLSAENSKE